MARDEQALAAAFPSLQGDARKLQGAYFTPAWLVDAVIDAVSPLLPKGPFQIVDPACGAGAFLEPLAARFPRARLTGLELSEDVAAFCRTRVPRAKVIHADALRGGLDALALDDRFTLFIGNPPYNGTSPLLTDERWYPKLRALLPEELPRGTSLRDDFAFFLLKAAARVEGRDGAIAFITPSSLLDSFLYAPLRRALLQKLSLVKVIELGASVFDGARVKTAVTVWTTAANTVSERRRFPLSPQSSTLDASTRPTLNAVTRYSDRAGASATFIPRPPDFLLRPAPDRAAELEAEWRERGENILSLVPVSLPGLKTRFDELLVDDDPKRLFDRVRAFLRSDRLDAFAREWDLEAKLPKLKALREFAGREVAADRSCVRRFFRYAGQKHRGAIPDSAHAWCYLDRRLIPRGDHRFRGEYDPHRCPQKLVFNTRELPLASAYVDVDGCVTAHRHARFAPLYVPQRIRDEGLGAARSQGELGPEVPNLSLRGLEWAERAGGPEHVFRAICAFINSREVQEGWAPAYGASRDLHVPLDREPSTLNPQPSTLNPQP